MGDPRYAKLAKLLVEYSCSIQKGEVLLLDMVDVPDEMSVALIRATRVAGGVPLVEVRHSRVAREIQRGTDEVHSKLVRDLEMQRMKRVDEVQGRFADDGTGNAFVRETFGALRNTGAAITALTARLTGNSDAAV
jgi:aminopeptidase